MDESTGCWYVAELIVEFKVDGEQRNVVHRNLVLVRAVNAEEALNHAVELGQQHDADWENTDGKLVEVRFLGLGHLGALEDGIKDGAEILWKENVGVGGDQIKEWLQPQKELAVFQSQRGTPDPDIPNYAPGDIVREADAAVQDFADRRQS